MGIANEAETERAKSVFRLKKKIYIGKYANQTRAINGPPSPTVKLKLKQNCSSININTFLEAGTGGNACYMHRRTDTDTGTYGTLQAGV